MESKNYHSYEKKNIGASDFAALLLRGASCAPVEMHFDEDGSYAAYIVDSAATIPAHYSKVFETRAWLAVYDDDGLAAKFYGDMIRVYRAGGRGCIIQTS